MKSELMGLALAAAGGWLIAGLPWQVFQKNYVPALVDAAIGSLCLFCWFRYT